MFAHIHLWQCGAASVRVLIIARPFSAIAAKRYSSFSKAGSFGMRAQFGRCAHMRPERTIGTHTAVVRVAGRSTVTFRKALSLLLAAWAAANEPGNVRQLCRRKLAGDLFDTPLGEQRDGCALFLRGTVTALVSLIPRLGYSRRHQKEPVRGLP